MLLNDLCHLLWTFMIYLRCNSAAHCDQSSTTFINYIFINHSLRQDQFFSATTVMLLMYRQVECSAAHCCLSHLLWCPWNSWRVSQEPLFTPLFLEPAAGSCYPQQLLLGVKCSFPSSCHCPSVRVRSCLFLSAFRSFTPSLLHPAKVVRLPFAANLHGVDGDLPASLPALGSQLWTLGLVPLKGSLHLLLRQNPELDQLCLSCSHGPHVRVKSWGGYLGGGTGAACWDPPSCPTPWGLSWPGDWVKTAWWRLQGRRSLLEAERTRKQNLGCGIFLRRRNMYIN